MRLKFLLSSIVFITILSFVSLYSSIDESGINRSTSSFNSSRSVADISCRQAMSEYLSASVNEENIMLWHLFKDDMAQVNARYLDHEDFDSLSADPDHNFKQTKTSLLEAVSGLYAQESGILAAGIARGPEGTEFVDGQGVFWDVKTPIAPLFDQNWRFNIAQSGNSIKHKLEAVDGIHILIDLSYIRPQNAVNLKEWINNNISKEHRSRIRYVVVPDGIVDY